MELKIVGLSKEFQDIIAVDNVSYRRKLREDFLVRKKRMLKIIIIVIVLVIVVVLGLLFYGKYQMSKIPELSFQEALEYTTKDNEEAVITVGIIKDGQMTYTVYGENGKELPKELHTYEIGSLTKTFTAAMICKGIQEEKIHIGDTRWRDWYSSHGTCFIRC